MSLRNNRISRNNKKRSKDLLSRKLIGKLKTKD